MAEARALMRRLGCIVVHTDDRAVEESAQEIIRHLNGRSGAWTRERSRALQRRAGASGRCGGYGIMQLAGEPGTREG